MNTVSLIQAIRGPVLLITLGALMFIDYQGIYSFGRTWPVLIIVFGILKLMERVGVPAGPSEPYNPPPSMPPPPFGPGGTTR
ncbi:MAG TPA: DUF5668 domain-containing protein [Bryobacteraceae bacterium]|nr:DUF5668 domain-containing protein [Bryobacteraceae bacterium]